MREKSSIQHQTERVRGSNSRLPHVSGVTTDASRPGQHYVSISKLSNFIDFYNYVPVKATDIRHKNTTSDAFKSLIGHSASLDSNHNRNIDINLSEN